MPAISTRLVSLRKSYGDLDSSPVCAGPFNAWAIMVLRVCVFRARNRREGSVMPLDRRQVLRGATALAAAAVPGLVGPTPAKAEGPNTDGGRAYLFPENFKAFKVQTAGAAINGVIGGQGPPVLLLHGYPQSH